MGILFDNQFLIDFQIIPLKRVITFREAFEKCISVILRIKYWNGIMHIGIHTKIYRSFQLPNLDVSEEAKEIQVCVHRCLDQETADGTHPGNSESPKKSVSRKNAILKKYLPLILDVKALLIPRLEESIEFLLYSSLSFLTSWALNNILSGNSEQTRAVVELGCNPTLGSRWLSMKMNVSAWKYSAE